MLRARKSLYAVAPDIDTAIVGRVQLQPQGLVLVPKYFPSTGENSGRFSSARRAVEQEMRETILIDESVH